MSGGRSTGGGGLRAAGVTRGAPLGLMFDGAAMMGFVGETVAAALLGAGILALRRSPRDAAPRGTFCWMGICQERAVVVAGHRRLACRTPLIEGMAVLSGTVP